MLLTALTNAALLAFAATAGAAPEVLTAAERTPCVVLLLTPRDLAPAAPPSAHLGAARAAFEPRTGLEIRSSEQAAVDLETLDACEPERRMSCWVRAVRPEEDAGAPAHAGRAPRRRPRFLLALAIHPLPGPGALENLSAMLIDVDLASARRREIPRSDPSYLDRVENAVYEVAHSAPQQHVDAGAPGALERYFTDLVERELRAPLEQAGEWDPFGAITLNDVRADLVVSLDGAALGATGRGGPLEIRGVRPGRRELTLSRGDRVIDRAAVLVERGGRALAMLAPEAIGEAPSTGADLLRWGGAAAGAAGVVLVALAAERAGAPIRGACLVRPGSGSGGCSTALTPGFGFDPAAAPTADRAAVNPPGVLIAPLGLALFGAGASWALGSELFVRDEDAANAWWVLAIGLGTGALTYIVGAAAAGN